MDTITPVLDNAVLQAKANEFAMNGAIETIKEFYTGWQSPYRKAINEKLAEIEIGTGLNLPDIIGILNTSLSQEVDAIANEAIAKTFVPMVKSFLTRGPKEVKFSEMLAELIELEYKLKPEDCWCSVEESKHGWLDIKINIPEKEYNLTFHKQSEISSKKENEVVRYQLLSLPWDPSKYSKTMVLKVDGVGTLELPFTSDVLRDRFASYIARLIMSKSEITMDCREFPADIFPEQCHCD